MSFVDFQVQDPAIEAIIEKHKNDFTYNTYASFINRAGGFKSYVRSLGGVFAKYIDFTGKITTKKQFSEIMDYVWGLYRIWGVDYSNGCSYTYAENKWKAYCGHGDAFYPTESPAKRFDMNYGAWGFGNGTDLPNIETMLSDSKYYAVTNCSQGVLQAWKKAGLVPVTFPDPAEYPRYYKEHGYTYKVIRNAADLQVGDVLIFTTQKIPNRAGITDVPNWLENFMHTAIVGKRDSQYIYMYDSGHAFTYYGEPINRRKIGDNNVYQWAADWIGLRYDCVAKLTTEFTGWRQEGGKWYYYEDGTKATGWRLIKWSKGTNWFYFDETGAMLTSWQKLQWSGGKSTFYFDSNGCMVTDWQEIKVDGKKHWYFFDKKTGAMVTGMKYLLWKGNYGWYIFDSDGKMRTGKLKVKVLFGSSGKLEGGALS